MPRSPFLLWTLGWLVFATFVLASTAARAGTIYVRADAAAGGNGQSWATAYNNIHIALAQVDGTTPTEIWLKTGVYRPYAASTPTTNDRLVTFGLKSNLTIRGGFAGTESAANQRIASGTATAFTVISGDMGVPQPDTVTATTPVNALESLDFDAEAAGAQDNSFNLFQAINVSGVTLDRLVVAGAYTNNSIPGGQIETMLYPSADEYPSYGAFPSRASSGGGLYGLNASVTVSDCWFVGNFSKGLGGAVAVRGGSLTVRDSRFARNFAGHAGGALCIQDAAIPELRDNTFYGNASGFLGGAVFIDAPAGNAYLKSYLTGALNALSAYTQGDADLAPDGHESDAIPYSYIKTIKAGGAVVQSVASGLASKALIEKYGSVALQNLAKQLSPLTTFYGAVSLAVNVVDLAFSIAQIAGVDPNNVHIRNWTLFSTNFAAYATPAGLAQTIYGLIYDAIYPPPTFAQRATALRNRDYADNHNKSGAHMLTRNRFEKNYSAGMGGGLVVIHANVLVTRSRFIENESAFGGAAITSLGYNTADIENSALVRNKTRLGHSAFSTAFRSVNRILNITVVENHSAAASGHAIGVDTGSDLILGNSILWDNTSGDVSSSTNPNRLGGADIFATRRADLDANGLKTYNEAGDSHGMFTGVALILRSNIQSLDRLALGGDLYAPNVTPEIFAGNRDSGYLLTAGHPNVGDGIAPVAQRANISRDPILLLDIYPHPSSPVINTGSSSLYFRDGIDYDIDFNSRVSDGRIPPRDMGAVETNGTFPSGVILYVNAAVSASGDGFTWATAFKTLPEALAQPLSPGGQIWVAAGTYPATGPMILAPGCSLVGGFASGAGSLTESDPVARPTIVSGANGATVLLSGLAKIPDISAYRKMLGLPRIIRGITFQSAGSAATAAAVRLSIPVVVQSCVFKNNTGARALSIEDPNNFYTRAAGQIIDSTFEANLAGAITCPNTNLEVIRSRFYDNVAPAGAAIHKGSTHSTQWLLLERNVFYNNTASAGRGGAVFLRGEDLVAAHNVFADNFAQPASGDTSLLGGAGIYWTTPDSYVSRLQLVNNILYGNRLLGALAAATPLEFQQLALPDLSDYGSIVLAQIAVITGNCIEGLNTIAPRGGSAGNVDYDPFFVAPAARDFSLAADSLLANRGSAYASGTDASTTINGVRDIGASEGADTTVRPAAVVALTVNKPSDTARTFTLQITNPVSGAGSYTWEVLRPGALGVTPVVNDAHHSGAATGVLTVSNLPHTWSGSRYRLRYTTPVRVFSNDVVLQTPPSILYVSAGATGDGTSWASPLGNVGAAFLLAQPYTQIWIRSGTHLVHEGGPDSYYDAYVTPGVRIYGGFAGTETSRAQRLSSTPPTLLHFGDNNASNQLTIRNTATWPSDSSPIPTVFDQVTITGPTTRFNKFCLELIGGDTVFNNVKFTDLAAAAVIVRSGQATFTGVESLRCAGTPITADGATITVANSSFSEGGAQTYQTYSGALTLANSTATITDSRFTANAKRPVVTSGSGSITIERSRFLDNRAGALQLGQSGASRVANSLFARNRTPGDGGAIVNASSGPVTLMHLTLVENSARTGGAIINNGASLTLANSIVWDNSATTAPAIFGTYTRVSSHVQGQVDYAPFFNPDAAIDDYRLADRSPLVNRGSTSAGSGSTDLLGNVRFQGTAPDLGAIESAIVLSTSVYFTNPPAHRVVYEDRPVSFAISGGIGSTTTTTLFDWQYVDSSGVVHPISDSPGWTIVRDGITTTLSHPSVPLSLNGLRLRLIIPTLATLADLRLDVLPRKVHRVDADGATPGDSSAWTSSFSTIGAALAAADGDTDLWIAGGDYPETELTAAEGTRLYVGFAGNETTIVDRDAVANPVRLVGAASRVTLVPTASHALPDFAFRIVAAPSALTRYVERPIAFTARREGSANLAWQYLAGANWLPISNLPGWTVTQVGETSTLAYPAAELAQNGLQVRAVVPGTTEASFETTLTVNPRSILYVNGYVPASGDGRSWATALKTIGEALARADDGTDIWIATGTYYDRTLTYVPGANLYSGFDGNETSLGDRNPSLRPVTLQGPGSSITFGATANGFRYAIATPTRSRALYIDQPGSLSTSLTGSGAAILWQYLDGSAWRPLTELSGWTVTTTGLLSKAVHLSFPATADGLKVRVLVPSTGEASAPVTLSVKTRVTRYVNGAATGTGSGASWTDAHTTLAAALALADDGTDIWIASGTYDEPTHSVGSGTHLYGGFAGTEATLADRTGSAPVSILRNGTGNRVLTVDLSSAEFDLLTLIEGVTLRNGTATAPLAYLKGRSIAFDTVTFAQSARAVFLEDAATLAEFSDCVFVSNTQAIVAAAGPAVSIDGSFFDHNTQALTFAAGSSLVVTDSDFSNSSDYAISAAPGISIGGCTFTANARDIVVTGEGTAVTNIDDSTFTGTTVCAIASATPVELGYSDFSGVALGLDLTGGAATSQIVESSFVSGTGDAVRAPAGIRVAETTFTANARGLVLSASATAASMVTDSTFANQTVAGLQSAGAVHVGDTVFNANATGLLLTAAADRSAVTGGTFTGNTTGVSTVSGLTVIDSTFTGDATGLAVTSGGTLGTTVNGTTFTGETVAGIVSAGRVSLDTVTFENCALGLSLTGGSGVSRLVATTFKDGVAGLDVAAPARAELLDPVFTGNSGVSLAATGASVVVGNVTQTNVLVTHGTFAGNTGPVFLSSSGYHKFDRCTFVDNVTANPILSATGGFLALHNTLVAHNTATNNSVVRASGSGFLSIATSTIADNESGTTVGAVGGNYSVTQSILWGNRASAASARVESMQADVGREITKSIIEGLQSSYLWIQPSAQNTAYDPLFTDARGGDYTLQPWSPAIDLGGSTFAGNLYDLAGAARVQSTAVDLGAYESATARAASPLKLTFPSAPRTIVTGDAATYAVTFATGDGRAIRWQVNTGSGWSDFAADAYHQFNYANGVSRLVVAGDFAVTGYRYRAVISDNGTDLYVSPDSLFTVVARPIFYVNASATGAATGADWANAFPTLDAALAVAPAFSDIRVAAGSYRAPAGSSFPLRRRQRLLGGYLAGTDTRDTVAHASTLSSAVGAPSDSIIVLSNSDQGLVDNLTTVEGFTFTSGGYGIVLNQASPVVRDCRFQGLGTGVNVFSSQLLLEDSVFTGQTRPAVIVYGSDSDITVSGCVFTNNAGALAMGDTSIDNARGGDQRAVITDSVFANNSVTGAGGAISSRNPGSALVISHCEFTGNTAGSNGGAIYAGTRNTISIRQSLLADNQAGSGSALYTSGTASLLFTTVAGNHATQTGEVSLSVVGGLVLRDSILWGNTTAGSSASRDDQIRFRLAGNPAVFADSIIEGLSGTPGTRLLPFDPKFIDATNGDYRLAADSPAIGLGQAADLLSGETDLDGTARPAGAAADLGAYEFTATPTAPAYGFNLPTTLTTPVGTGFTFTQATPAGFTSVWEYFDGSVWRAINLIGQPSTGPAGAYSYTTFDPGTGQSTVKFSSIDTPLNGVLLRYRLTYSGTDYTSPSIAITVPGFETLYVDASVPASGNGRTWASAFKTLGEALAAVNTTHRVIHVAEGTYGGPFAFPMRFEIYGGFPAGGSTLAGRDVSAHATVLTGLPAVVSDPRATAVVRFLYSGTGYTQPIMDGFTVEDGQTGLLADANVTPTLRNLLVRGHTATGLVLQGSNALVQDSVFENNTGFNGGALRASSFVTLERVILRGNTATSGGALHALATATLRNVLLSGNVAATGGALWTNSPPVLEQTTVAGNRADTHPALYVHFGAAVLRNSIVWGNRTTSGAASPQLSASVSASPSTFTLDHTLVEQATVAFGALRFDPLFTAPVAASSAPSTTGDYTLRAISPAIDAGSDALAAGQTLDLDRAPRFVGTVDLGAYESATTSSAPFSLTGQSGSFVFDRQVASNNTFSVTATNAASYLWQYAAPGGEWLSLDGVAGFSGATSATLSVTDGNVALNGYRFRVLITGSDGSVVTGDERVLTVYAPHLHVNANRPGSETGDGLSWATAYKSLETALAAIPTVPDSAEIWIAAGTYTPASTFTVRAGVSLYGGFAGTETARDQRDPSVNVTALVAPSGGSSSIVTIAATPALSVPARFDSLTLRDNATGRGIDNEAGRRPLEIERVRFTGIVSYTIYSYNASVVIRRSEFRGNGTPATNDDLLRVLFGSALVENTLFAGNHSNGRSTVSFSAPVTFRNVTIAHNVCGSPAYFGDGNTQIYNSVFWGNRTTAGAVSSPSYSGNLYVAFSNVAENLFLFEYLFNNKQDNVGFDPLFIAPVAASTANNPNTNGDYTLGLASLAIDRGRNDAVASGSVDLAGNPRRHALHVDPGAYEFQGDDGIYSIVTQPADRSITSGNALFTIAASRVATYTWETSTDGGATFTAIPGAVYSNIAAGVTSTFPVAASAANHGRVYRARVQFTTGPLQLSEPASLACLVSSATLTRPAGHGTPATFAATANIAPDSWQWQFSTDGGTTFEDVSGATASTLSVADDASLVGRGYRARALYTAGPDIASNTASYAYSDLVAAPGYATSTANRTVALDVTGGVQTASLTDASLFVHADLMGRIPLSELGAPVFSGNTLTIPFITAQHGGERVQVTTSALRRADGLGLRPRVWEFRMRVLSGPGLFEAPVTVGAAGATAFALGDFNEVGWVDALVATSSGLQLYSNTGGVFTASGSSFGPSGATALAAAALTPAGALDAAAITADGDVQLWFNDGTGAFTLAQTLADLDAQALAFGDLDADGDLDLFVATATGNAVFLNNGSGALSAASTFGSASASSLALGDLDQDGDLDAFVVGSASATLWLNDGSGAFSSGSTAGTGFDRVALADLDADNRLDVVLVAANSPATLLRNLGGAIFETLDTVPGGGASATLATGDTDGDGRADLVLTDTSGRTGAWLTSAALDSARYPVQPAFTLGAAAELADLNDDGSLDLFGLTPAGVPVVARYAQIGATGAEDSTFSPAAAGYRPTPVFQAIDIIGRPAHGTVLINGQPIRTTPNQFGHYGSFNYSSAHTVTYRPDPDFNGVDSFVWKNAFDTTPRTYWIRVTDVPDAVVAVSDSIAVLEGATATTLVGGATSLLANDTNQDAGALSANLVNIPTHGTLTINPDGTLAYTPATGFYGTDSFTYQAANADTGSASTTAVSIVVTRLNDAPAGLALAATDGVHYTGRPAGETVATLSATDTDPEDAGVLVFSLVGGSGADHNGDFVIDGAALRTATPIDAAPGLTRSVRIRVTDTLGLFSEQSFTVAFTQAPAAANATVSTTEDIPVTVTLPGSGGATTLAYQLVTPPAHGSLTRPDAAVSDVNTLVYVPDANFHGTDTLVYRVLDSALGSANATVTINVAAVNDTPTLADVAPITIDEDASASFTLVGADVETASLAYQLTSTPALGTVQVNGAAVTYTPAAHAHGVETLVFTASDGVNTSAAIQVVVTITSIDDLPVIAAIAPRTVQRNRVDTFTASVTDAESPTTTLRVGTAPAHGSVVISTHSVTYTPDTGYSGADSYTLIANDGALDSAPATVAVTVAPIATENVAITVYRGLYEYTDVPAYSGSGTWTGASIGNIGTPAHGTAGIEGARLVYDHDGGSATSDSFTYTVTNAADDIRTIAVSVTIKDRVLDVTDGSFFSATGNLRAAIDLTNRFAADTVAPAHTTGATWLIRILPQAGPTSTLLHFTSDAQNGASFFRIQGNVTIDAVASPGHVLTGYFPGTERHFLVTSGASLTLKHLVLLNGGSVFGGSVLNFGTFVAEDMVFRLNSADLGAALYNNGGAASLTDCVFDQNIVDANDSTGGIIASRNGSISLTRVAFTANTGKAGGELHVAGDGALATVNVTDSTIPAFHLLTQNGGTLAVTGLPKATDDAFTYTIGQTLHVSIASLTANDLGTPAASISVAATSAKGVTVTRTGDNLAYLAPVGVTTSDSFTYTITDAAGRTSTATVALTFVNAAALPRGNADTGSIYRGLHGTIDVLANDTDDTGDTLTLTAVTTPAHGTAVIESGVVRYTHDGHASGTDSFTYSVTNSSGTTANVPVTVTIAERVIDATSGADSGPGTLRSALALVESFASTTLPPAHTTTPDWTIRIVGASGQRWETTTSTADEFVSIRSAFRIAGKVTIDATLSPGFELQSQLASGFTSPVRNFFVRPGASLTLKNLRLVGLNMMFFDHVFFGGAVLNQGTFVADNVDFEGYRADRGATFYNEGGTATLVDCSFSNNETVSFHGHFQGGAIYSTGGSLTLVGNTFADEYINPEVNAQGSTAVFFGEAPTYSVLLGESVTTPEMPVATNDTVERPYGKTFKLSVASLLANDLNATGATVAFSATTQQGYTLTRSGAFLLYQAPASFGGGDSFTYTITRTVSKLIAGSTRNFTITSTATVNIGVTSPPESATIAPTLSIADRGDGGLIIRVIGIPGRPYTIERSYTLQEYSWTTVDSFTVPANGLHQYEDGPIPPWDPDSGEAPIDARFYRVRYNQ